MVYPISIFLISFSVIVFEISISRLLSALFSYHYVFWVLSVALLGLGLGAVLAWFLLPQTPSERNKPLYLGWYTFSFALTVPASVFLTILTARLDSSLPAILIAGPLLCVPFLAAGVFLACMFRFFPRIGHRLYGMDLLGAGAGAWGAVLLMDAWGGLHVHFLIAAAAATAALMLSLRAIPGSKTLPVLSLSFLAMFSYIGLGLQGDDLFRLPIGRNPEKEIFDALTSFRGELVENRWTAFGRTDLVVYRSRPEFMDFYLDGTAGSPMYRFTGRKEDLSILVEKEFSDFPGSFAFKFLKPDALDSALIIGPGGGRDVLLALWGGLRKIQAVEINRDLVELARRHSSFNGGIFEGTPNIEIVIEEGRRFLRRQTEKHDLIFLSLPVTNSSRSLEGYSLTENYLFTLESMAEYWEHLTRQGSLVFVGHNDAEILRLLVLALKTLGKKGFSESEVMKHVYIVSSGDYACFVLRKTAFTPAEAIEMHREMVRRGFRADLSFFPVVKPTIAVNPVLSALSTGRIGADGLIGMVEARGWDLRPVSDDRPFFYKLETGIPRPVLFAAGTGLALLSGVLLLSGLIKPNPRRIGEKGNFWVAVVLFSSLGVGFMLAELSLLARFTLFFGSPVRGMAVFLSSLLGWAGLSSWLSRRWLSEMPERRIRAASLAIFPCLVGYTLILPLVGSRLDLMDEAWRIFWCAVLLMPVGILSGIPFPAALQWLHKLGMEDRIAWMYGINGVSSVAGSTMAVLIAISSGFQQALFLSAALYFFVFVLMGKACVFSHQLNPCCTEGGVNEPV